MTPKRTAFHVGEYLAEEMAARGWTSRDLAERMARPGEDVDVWLLTVDLTLAWDSDGPQPTLGTETAERLEQAFGTSAQTWLNLESAYFQALKQAEN
jgi:HTH-type transcriptional regulator / antitoxin HigA